MIDSKFLSENALHMHKTPVCPTCSMTAFLGLLAQNLWLKEFLLCVVANRVGLRCFDQKQLMLSCECPLDLQPLALN